MYFCQASHEKEQRAKETIHNLKVGFCFCNEFGNGITGGFSSRKVNRSSGFWRC